MSDEWCVRCGAGPPRQAGAEMAEKLGIRKQDYSFDKSYGRGR
jgi:hypothetical protein